MFNRKIQQNNKQDMTLYKFKSNYDKVVKEMQEAPKDYDTIKELIESKNNSITKLENNINKKSKNDLQIQSHHKLKK